MRTNPRSLLAKLKLANAKSKTALKLIAGKLFLLLLASLLAGCPASCPTVPNKTLTVVIDDPRTFTLSWSATLGEGEMVYDFYFSDKDNIRTPAEAKANGMLYMEAWRETSFTVYDAKPGADIYLNIVSRCPHKYETAYETKKITMPEVVDVGNGELIPYRQNNDSLTIIWKKAYDELQPNFGVADRVSITSNQYQVYYSENPAMDTVEEILRNGRLWGAGQNEEHRCRSGQTNLPEHCGNAFKRAISGLQLSKRYYFNVIATDHSGHYRSAYKKLTVTTYMNFGERSLKDSISSGEYKFYGVEFDAASALDPEEITISLSGRGEAQELYVRRNVFPEWQSGQYDCKAVPEYYSGNSWSQECVFTISSPTMVYVVVNGNDDGDFSVNGKAVSLVSRVGMHQNANDSFDNIESPWRYYKIPFSYLTNFDIMFENQNNEVELYAQFDRFPTPSDFVCSAVNDTGNPKACSITAQTGKILYIGLRNKYGGSGEYRLYFRNVRGTLASVSSGQGDEWACGVHALHRIFKTYGMNHSLSSMRSTIGQGQEIQLMVEVVEYVLKKIRVCDIPVIGPMVCDLVSRLVKVLDLVNMRIFPYFGRPPEDLVRKVNQHYSQANARYASFGSSKFSKIQEFVGRGIPVMALIAAGKRRVKVLGISGLYSDVPLLHWIIISGYDNEKVYYYNTGNGAADEVIRKDGWKYFDYEDRYIDALNTERSMPIGRFLSLWAWNYGNYDHGVIHNALVNGNIARPNTVFWLSPRNYLRSVQ